MNFAVVSFISSSQSMRVILEKSTSDRINSSQFVCIIRKDFSSLSRSISSLDMANTCLIIDQFFFNKKFSLSVRENRLPGKCILPALEQRRMRVNSFACQKTYCNCFAAVVGRYITWARTRARFCSQFVKRKHQLRKISVRENIKTMATSQRERRETKQKKHAKNQNSSGADDDKVPSANTHAGDQGKQTRAQTQTKIEISPVQS